MCVKELGIIIFLREVHFSNTLLSIVFKLYGKRVSTNDSQRRKAPSKILFTESGISIVWREIQYQNILNIDNQ